MEKKLQIKKFELEDKENQIKKKKDEELSISEKIKLKIIVEDKKNIIEKIKTLDKFKLNTLYIK